jgi:pimeloyl-ACP methyl ester carboxylesterase
MRTPTEFVKSFVEAFDSSRGSAAQLNRQAIEVWAMRAKIRDTTLFFDVDGAGLVVAGDGLRERPVAFLLHGGPGADHTSYKPMFEPLTALMQLVYLDHRGQGRSARGNPATYTLDNNVEDLEALRDYLGLERVVVIGGSYGGMVGMAYASRYPDRVAQLIVYATAASYQLLGPRHYCKPGGRRNNRRSPSICGRERLSRKRS